jgi:hypothetical protein
MTLLVPDWKEAWRWWSVQCAALLAFLDMLYDYIPLLYQYFPNPNGWVRWAAVLFIMARVLRQQQKGGR